MHRIETVENTGFVPAPRKSARTVRNRRFVRFIHTVHRGEKTVLHGLPCGEWSRTLEKNVERGTAPNRTVGFTISENRTEPYRRIPDFLKNAPNRSVGYITAPNRAVGFRIFQNRTEPHRRISYFSKPHRTVP